MAALGFGPAELAVLIALLSGFGLPLGVPPERENPAMSHVAPEQCVLYASWAAMAAPDAKSTNHTERLLAEPELQAFLRSFSQKLDGLKDYHTGRPRTGLEELVPVGKALLTRAGAIFVTKVTVEDEAIQLEGGLLLEAGGEARSMADVLVSFLSSPKVKPEAVLVNGERFQRFASQPDSLGEMTIGASGNYVIVGLSKGSVEGILRRLQAKKTPAWLVDLQGRHALERRSSISVIDVKALTKTLLPLLDPETMGIAKSLGLEELGRIEAVTGLDKEGMVSRTFLKIDGEPQGLLKLVGGSAIKPERVNFVPRDAAFASAVSLNLQHVYELVAKVLAENSPGGVEDAESLAKLFEQRFGMRLKEDLIAALGDVWTVSLSPVDGWLGVVATGEVRDREKLAEMFERIKDLLSDPALDNEVRIESSKFGDHELQSLHIAEAPFRLTWCLTGKQLVIGLQPQVVKSALDLKVSEQGLFSRPDVAWAFQGEGNTIGVTYLDTPKVFETFYGTLTTLLPMFAEGSNRQYLNRPLEEPAPALFDFATLPPARSIHRHLRPSVSVTRRTKSGLEMEVRQTIPTTAVPVGIALLLPATQSARVAARRSESTNNLKQIMLAIHNHHDTHNALPPQATTDKDGKPLLSWRVMLLPYIEQQALYNEFHLDEPWDSEHNKALIKKMPKVYKSPVSLAEEGKTVYLGVSGDNGIFPPSKKPSLEGRGTIGFRDVLDGLSNSIAVVEANDDSAVIWTRPDDFVPDEKNALKGLVGLYPNGFNIGMCDGSVRFVSESINPKTLLLLFKRSDGAPVPNW